MTKKSELQRDLCYQSPILVVLRLGDFHGHFNRFRWWFHGGSFLMDQMWYEWKILINWDIHLIIDIILFFIPMSYTLNWDSLNSWLSVKTVIFPFTFPWDQRVISMEICPSSQLPGTVIERRKWPIFRWFSHYPLVICYSLLLKMAHRNSWFTYYIT